MSEQTAGFTPAVPTSVSLPGNVVKQGWLYKRGKLLKVVYFVGVCIYLVDFD